VKCLAESLHITAWMQSRPRLRTNFALASLEHHDDGVESELDLCDGAACDLVLGGCEVGGEQVRGLEGIGLHIKPVLESSPLDVLRGV
jgi:hypothetical protein